MSHSIATLLMRNLIEVFGEGDDARRRAVIDEIFHEYAVFIEPHGVFHGRDEIARIAAVIHATHPTFRYSPIAPAEELRRLAGRLRWVAGYLGHLLAYAGTDFVVARDGRIAAVYLFFDGEPDLTGAAIVA